MERTPLVSGAQDGYVLRPSEDEPLDRPSRGPRDSSDWEDENQSGQRSATGRFRPVEQYDPDMAGRDARGGVPVAYQRDAYPRPAEFGDAAREGSEDYYGSSQDRLMGVPLTPVDAPESCGEKPTSALASEAGLEVREGHSMTIVASEAGSLGAKQIMNVERVEWQGVWVVVCLGEGLGVGGGRGRGSLDDDAASVGSAAASARGGGGNMKGSPSVDSLSSTVDDHGAGAALNALSRTTGVRASTDILAETSRKPTGKETVVDQYIKDAYLVFRALAKLSMKNIPEKEGATDLKSQSMRSKLLSLTLIHQITTSHMHVFFTPAPILFAPGTGTHNPSAVLFVYAVKQNLCLTLSRNAVSIVPPVFDLSMRIFGAVLGGLRSVLKKELSVLFTAIIIPLVEARTQVAFHQRTAVLQHLQNILSDPHSDGGRTLVEIYLNYDCDVEAGARENIWERLMNAVAKIMSMHQTDGAPTGSTTGLNRGGTVGSGSGTVLTTAQMTRFTKEQLKELESTSGDVSELKRRGLEFMVRGVLKPLVQWCNVRMGVMEKDEKEQEVRRSEEGEGGKLGILTDEEGKKVGGGGGRRVEDDPMAFETLRHRKQVLVEGVKRFNFKPKKGMQYLLDSSCIPSRTPRDIARFLLHTEGLNKAMIGEFLGEGDEENITIMHAFVDEMDFTGLKFTEAMRTFLQSFRLPGESQKIDRFMLKFADRFCRGNPGVFSSADTAYVLAYSVVMLNTDQHNAQVKRRMTKADFLKNNRGIDNGQDLPAELLEGIFDEIQSNEIVMKDEQPAKAAAAAGGGGAADGARRGGARGGEVLNQVGSMADRAGAMLESLKVHKPGGKRGSTVSRAGSGTGRDGEGLGRGMEDGATFYSATHYEHVRGMFQVIWMSVLSGLSTPLQESEEYDTVVLALEGFKYAIHIACLFDMELERKAFVSTLSKFTQFTQVGTFGEMRAKNFEATKALLEVGIGEGDKLGESWREVVVCVSQLERLGGLADKEDVRSSRASVDSRGLMQRRESVQALRKPGGAGGYLEEAAAEANSQVMTITVDKIFTGSVKLGGSAIVWFVRALCEVSWDEIQSTSDQQHPRMYCLQRLVEISYYNMKRIRVEWSNIWAILGEHFNQVGCHPNPNVAFFAIDKLRQLAMKFLELEELPNFKFQKDFLRPFEVVMGGNVDVKVKDMVLACLQQMIQAKGKSLRSGWKAMFGAFLRAAREGHEPIVLLAFDIVKGIFKNNFESVVLNQTYADFVGCLVEFCKNRKFPRTSLHAIELLKQSIPRIYELSKNAQTVKALTSGGSVVMRSTEALVPPESSSTLVASVTQQPKPEDDPNFRFWFPILFGLYEVVMMCDLEVRTRALTYLFDTLKQYGNTFTRDFWEVVSKGVLFPIFDDLRLSRQEHTKFANKEDMSVWLSTTLIQALRQFIDLFGYFYDTLSFQIDGVLELLAICMTQENETLARIGSTCLQQFVEGNYGKLGEGEWERICGMFVGLFESTTPYALFFDLEEEGGGAGGGGGSGGKAREVDIMEDNGESAGIGIRSDTPPPPESGTQPAQPTSPNSTLRRSHSASNISTHQTSHTHRPRPQKKEFQQIIVKCVLHLLVIQTLHEVLSSGPDDAVYHALSSKHLFVMMDCLERSYVFAREFNANKELRMALFRMGFMKQLPNLLKQETSSVSCYVGVLCKMVLDGEEGRKETRGEIERRLIPLSFDILLHYNSLDPDSKRRDVNAWRPVVVMILNALMEFDGDLFKKHVPVFYGEICKLLLQDVTPDIRAVLFGVFGRIGIEFGVAKELVIGGEVGGEVGGEAGVGSGVGSEGVVIVGSPSAGGEGGDVGYFEAEGKGGGGGEEVAVVEGERRMEEVAHDEGLKDVGREEVAGHAGGEQPAEFKLVDLEEPTEVVSAEAGTEEPTHEAPAAAAADSALADVSSSQAEDVPTNQVEDLFEPRDGAITEAERRNSVTVVGGEANQELERQLSSTGDGSGEPDRGLEEDESFT
ncbi:guanine nucleotide exchange protein for ADP-robosylation factor [Rhizophlyctis rosea]|nr:guanine nucleotide exchange protein for ADP-robosylation factor [Rhizophlyctis rosea]